MARTRKRFWAWTLTLTAALLAVVWVVSMKVTVSVAVPPHTTLYLESGGFTFSRWEKGNLSTTVETSLWNRNRWKAYWWFSMGQGRDAKGAPWLTFCRIPLWPFVLLTGVPGVWLLFKTRKHTNPNACPACGYDRTGLPQSSTGPAPCPECGKG